MQPIILDENVVGYTLFFHPSFQYLVKGLRVPPDFWLPDELIAAILPWTLTPQQFKHEESGSHLDASSKLKPTMEIGQWHRSLRTLPKYQLGLRILGFPSILHDFITSRKGLPYSIWPDKQGPSKVNLEVGLLDEVLKQLKATKVSHKVEARIVFVHVGHLRTLHLLPALVQRRADSQHITFYTFGSHDEVSPRSWTMDEIYRTGQRIKRL